MHIIGLTGGIGSGKSTVAHLFSALGVPIIDADVIAKEILETRKTYIEKVIAHFGTEITDEKAQLDRAKLRHVIFTDSTARAWLEKLLHPPILSAIRKQLSTLAKQHTPYCIVVIPLLTEVKETQALVDRILLVDIAEKTQIARTAKRDQLTPYRVEKMLLAQASRAARLAIADDVIENEEEREALAQKVQKLHAQYMCP
jgi:dephospho-CoA kinase